MITRFFSTSKPIHLVLVAIFAFILFSLERYNTIKTTLNLRTLVVELGMFLVAFASISIFAFFVNKNNLSQRNSYKILFYVLLVAIIPATFKYDNILMSNLFVLLALRRLFSLRTNLKVKKKVFDAAIWITVATLFYFWAILFFPLIFAALLLFGNTQLKNWFIPIIGFLCVLIIFLSFSIITTNTFGDISNFILPLDYNFSHYNTLEFIVGITIILSFAIWSTFYYLRSFKEKQKIYKSSHVLVLYTTFIALIIIIISPDKNGSEFLFLLAPLSIILSNYIERVSELWFAEIFIWLLIVTPVVKLML